MAPDPYRTNDAAPRRSRGDERSETTRASTLPLGVIAITFFLPMVRVCDDRVVSPVSESTRSAGGFFIITPVFFSAAVLCASIVYSYVTKRSATLAALVAMAWSVLATGFGAAAAVGDHGNSWLALAIAAVCAPLYGFAWSSRGMRRLALLVDAYVFSAFPVALLIGAGAAFYGAYIFLTAYIMLALLRAFDLMNRCAAALRVALRERGRARRPAR